MSTTDSTSLGCVAPEKANADIIVKQLERLSGKGKGKKLVYAYDQRTFYENAKVEFSSKIALSEAGKSH